MGGEIDGSRVKVSGYKVFCFAPDEFTVRHYVSRSLRNRSIFETLDHLSGLAIVSKIPVPLDISYAKPISENPI